MEKEKDAVTVRTRVSGSNVCHFAESDMDATGLCLGEGESASDPDE